MHSCSASILASLARRIALSVLLLMSRSWIMRVERIWCCCWRSSYIFALYATGETPISTVSTKVTRNTLCLVCTTCDSPMVYTYEVQTPFVTSLTKGLKWIGHYRKSVTAAGENCLPWASSTPCFAASLAACWMAGNASLSTPSVVVAFE